MDRIKELFYKIKNKRGVIQKKGRLKNYFDKGQIPWSEGYEDHKWDQISEAINDAMLLSGFGRREKLPDGYGKGIDERIVEYPYVFSKLTDANSRILDAGSTFNFLPVVSHPLITKRDLTIFTAFPEKQNYIEREISYAFGDLRDLPFRNDWFDEIVCMSTLEHIGMDNAIYGYGPETIKPSGHDENKDRMLAISELVRVLKKNGKLFITVPFGRRINYGYFMQFDSGIITEIKNQLDETGKTEITYFKYQQRGWQFSEENECIISEAYNPHTGQGKGNDGAAHSRAICGIQYTKER